MRSFNQNWGKISVPFFLIYFFKSWWKFCLKIIFFFSILQEDFNFCFPQKFFINSRTKALTAHHVNISLIIQSFFVLSLFSNKSGASFWFFCYWPRPPSIAAEHIGNCRFNTFKAVRNSTKYGKSLNQILFITQLSCICSINYLCLHICAISLLLAGDVEINPGPSENYRSTVLRTQKAKNELKIFQLNCQSLVKKKHQLKNLMNVLGRNFIYCFTETWFTENDHEQLYNADKENFCCFRYNRKLMNEKKVRRGDGVMILARNIYNQKYETI